MRHLLTQPSLSSLCAQIGSLPASNLKGDLIAGAAEVMYKSYALWTHLVARARQLGTEVACLLPQPLKDMQLRAGRRARPVARFLDQKFLSTQAQQDQLWLSG